jgi:hypothetical protein
VPGPCGGLEQKSPLYRWSDVAAWLDRVRGRSKRLDTTEADAIAFLNAALELRRPAPNVPEVETAVKRLRVKPNRFARSGKSR